MERQCNGWVFALQVYGAYIILEGLIHGGAYFPNCTVTCSSLLYIMLMIVREIPALYSTIYTVLTKFCVLCT